MAEKSSTSTSLIQDLKLEPHPEGGYFVVTDVEQENIPSPFADKKPRSLATSIYYLLSHDRPSGVFHMNKSVTYHVLHQGRAEYTLIHPSDTPGVPPRIEKVVMGADISAGETRMLLVGTGVWKRSSLLKSDLDGSYDSKDEVNCLITEVVTPGFDWEDHKYMDEKALRGLFDGVEDGERWINEFKEFTKYMSSGSEKQLEA